MRYYSVKIDGAPAAFPARYDDGAQWGTLLNGQHDANAQQVEFSLWVVRPSDGVMPSSTLTISGVSWDQVNQFSSLVGKPITIRGGMSPGLPLATYQSQHSGLLVQGIINQCWGNWLGTDMSIGMAIVTAGDKDNATDNTASPSNTDSGNTNSAPASPQSQAARYNRTGPRSIDRRAFPTAGRRMPRGGRVGGPTVAPRSGFDFVQDVGGFLGGGAFQGLASETVGNEISSFFGGGGGLVAPLNFIHNLQPNMLLSSAIQETLSKVFPNANLKINISPALKLAYQDAGMYQNFEQYAMYIKNLSHSILGTHGYPGVEMATNGNTIVVSDSTQTSSPSLISALDLIGQPTWVEQNLVDVCCVLRGDHQFGDVIQLPQGALMGINPEAGVLQGQTEQRSTLTFNGTFRIKKMHHIGDFRNPDGVQWSTHYICIPESANAPGQAAAATVQQSNANQSSPSQAQTDAEATARAGVQQFGSVFKRGVRRF